MALFRLATRKRKNRLVVFSGCMSWSKNRS